METLKSKKTVSKRVTNKANNQNKMIESKFINLVDN